MSNENGSDRGKYQPKIFFRYLDADVWERIDIETDIHSVAYTEDVIAEILGDRDSDDNDPDIKSESR